MIRLTMTLVPYGEPVAGEHPLLTGSICSTVGAEGQPAHGYRLAVANCAGVGSVVKGEVSKDRSGHRNPLHLLAAVAADLDLEALGIDYATTLADLPVAHPERRQDRRRRIDDTASECIDRIRALAAAGEEGVAALRQIEAALASAKAGIAAPPRGAEGPVTDPDVIDAIADGCYPEDR
ncbi:hypothetical protein [Azospirillum soli]|uniref:hypothetical protein n=1 Tax=Azospirillum soli TaxID=1304799 RepID=UPI001AE5A11F|nr:hypothetical protein [Azospirillum soli]MBP2315502.1 hypothetical protein [Azospirillum soli]